MSDASAPRDILAETMTQGKKVLVPMLAEMLKRKGIETVESKEERRRFWQRAATPEQEALMWQQEMANRGLTELVPGAPQTLDIGLGISKRVYPDRWDMAPGEGRDTESAQAEWAARHARKGPPEAEAAPAEPAEQGMGETY
jgi:hypothetical protein